MASVNFNEESTMSINLSNEDTIKTKVADINYIPSYKIAELERQANEKERIAYYNEIQQKVANGEFNGRDGIDGQDGKDGEKGDKGEQGIQGIQGERGLQGEKGDKGDVGDTGYTLKNTLSGESVTIEDAVEFKLFNLEIDGKSVQNGTPTPETPVEIKSVGYENLFDGVFRQGNPKELVVDRLFNANNFKLKGNQSYTISTNLDTSIFRYAVNLNVNEFPIVSTQNFYDSGWKTVSSFTFTPSQDCYFGIPVSRINNTDLTPEDISSYWFVLEEGSKTHSYIPCGKSGIEVKVTNGTETNTKVLVLNEPLRSLPNGVKDTAYIKNNKLYVDRYVGSVVLNGSENWSTYSSQKLDNTSYFVCTVDSIFNSIKNFYSSHFVFAHIWGNDVVGLYLETTNGDNIRMRIPNSIASTPEELKTWLSNNNVKIDYELATPITEEVGAYVINTYEGVNNIELEANLKTNFSVTYAQDIKLLLKGYPSMEEVQSYVDSQLGTINEQLASLTEVE